MVSELIEPIIEEMIEFFESEFIKKEPDMQEALVSYAKSMSLKLDEWAKSKLEKKGQ